MTEEMHDTHHNKDLGNRGEEAAARFLQNQDFEILERNWTCKAGEADIVALDDTHLHFVEVKTRMSDGRGFPEEAVDKKKRQRYERIAECYLRTYDGPEIGITFDVIAINVLNESHAMLRFYRNVLACDCC